MKKALKSKDILAVMVCIFTIFLFFLPQNACLIAPPLRLYLLIEVVTDDAVYYQTKQDILRLREQLKRKDIEFKKIIIDKIDQFSIQDVVPDQESQLKDHLDDYFKDWDYTFTDRKVSLSLKKIVDKYYRDIAVRRALETIRIRLKKLRLRGAVIERQTPDGERIILKLPQVKNPERVKIIIKTMARLELKLVRMGPAPKKEMLLKDFGGEVPDDMEIIKGDPKRTEGGYYLVYQGSIVSGGELKNARPVADEWGNPAIALTFIPEAVRRLNKMASENIGKPLSIVLDRRIQEVSIIQDKLNSNKIIMHGGFTIDETKDIALLLRAGALPASVRYLEERTIDSR